MCFCVVFFVFMCWILLVTWVCILMSVLVFISSNMQFSPFLLFPVSGIQISQWLFSLCLLYSSFSFSLTLCEYGHLCVCVIFSFLHQFGCFLIYWFSFLLCLICFSLENSPGRSTGVGNHSLLQGIFPTQGLNLVFPHHRQILYHLSHQGGPTIRPI